MPISFPRCLLGDGDRVVLEDGIAAIYDGDRELVNRFRFGSAIEVYLGGYSDDSIIVTEGVVARDGDTLVFGPIPN